MQYVIIKAQRPDTALRLGCGIHGTQPVVVAAAAAAAQRFRWRPQACDSDGPGPPMIGGRLGAPSTAGPMLAAGLVWPGMLFNNHCHIAGLVTPTVTPTHHIVV